ncbi:KdsC family phosphatase [Thiopseudomonas denitrificans]|uniref:3-deoxy-D-manno-octulosonate 8-phosphate phosphatase KdsC n=1 Tax=Thiopseudomonas denitrificans TaxID=1501432 RepID=A0A4R6TUK9_9GAMM|nr:HAD hydrolase family protein [Thiopseudomonas denitrificans]TDQ36292.1 3-deoxy-D-manno-octulosonate 8-phosphate phosphatase (KDO 8-P phosphatase) [Thiopseudomonas denitrificans]
MLDTNNIDLLERARKVRLVVFDVDGVLTDGRLNFLPDGTEFKSFSTLDGQGIKMLMNNGIQTAIITGRTSEVVKNRAANLGIPTLIQGREDKRTALDEVLVQLQLEYGDVAYLGDDLPDLPAIRCVSLGVAVANANSFVRQHADAVTSLRGGEGAARELCEFILHAQGTLDAARQAYL